MKNRYNLSTNIFDFNCVIDNDDHPVLRMNDGLTAHVVEKFQRNEVTSILPLIFTDGIDEYFALQCNNNMNYAKLNKKEIVLNHIYDELRTLSTNTDLRLSFIKLDNDHTLIGYNFDWNNSHYQIEAKRNKNDKLVYTVKENGMYINPNEYRIQVYNKIFGTYEKLRNDINSIYRS